MSGAAVGPAGSREPLRVAFAGTGHVHVQDYVAACAARDDVRIVGACPDADSPFRLPLDIPIVEAPDGLTPHDVCAVTGDIVSHEHVARAMTAPAVFVEKPLGASAAAARRVSAILARDDRRVHTGFFLRHEPALRMLGARLAPRRIGRLREIRLIYEHDGRIGPARWRGGSSPRRSPALSRCSTRCARAMHAVARRPRRRSP